LHTPNLEFVGNSYEPFQNEQEFEK